MHSARLPLRHRLPLAATLAVALSMLAAPSASALSIGVGADGVMNVTAISSDDEYVHMRYGPVASGLEESYLQMEYDRSKIYFQGAEHAQVGSGCEKGQYVMETPGSSFPLDVRCSLAGVERIVIETGSGEDAVNINGYANDIPAKVIVKTNAGPDRIWARIGSGESFSGAPAPQNNGLDVHFDGGAGPDTLANATSRPDRLVGGPSDSSDGADVIGGSSAASSIAGGAGNDTIAGGGGNDTVHGQAGKDQLGGGLGADKLDGGPGSDKLRGGPGDDRLYGMAGADWVYGDTGADQVHGGTGIDRIFGNAGNDKLFGRDFSYVDRLDGGAGRDAGRYDARDTRTSVESRF